MICNKCHTKENFLIDNNLFFVICAKQGNKNACKRLHIYKPLDKCSMAKSRSAQFFTHRRPHEIYALKLAKYGANIFATFKNFAPQV